MKENILRFASEQGLDIRNLEKRAGLSANFISHIIRDKSTNPGILSLIKLADTLEISLDELTGRKRKYLREKNEKPLNQKEKVIFSGIFKYVSTKLLENNNVVLSPEDINAYIYELTEYCMEAKSFDANFANWLFKKKFIHC